MHPVTLTPASPHAHVHIVQSNWWTPAGLHGEVTLRTSVGVKPPLDISEVIRTMGRAKIGHGRQGRHVKLAIDRQGRQWRRRRCRVLLGRLPKGLLHAARTLPYLAMGSDDSAVGRSILSYKLQSKQCTDYLFVSKKVRSLASTTSWLLAYRPCRRPPPPPKDRPWQS
jgi:hypothetical protein